MKVTLLSLSQIDRDWRVRRHAQLLHDAGHDVQTVGLRGDAAALPWPATEIDLPPWTTTEKLTQAARLATVRLRPGRALATYWASARYQALYQAAVSTGAADLYVANDWNTLPVAARLAHENGARYAYDTHEYAVEERADRARWRLVWPPFLRALESELIPGAQWISTVSDGIADLLQADHRLRTRPTVIRNVPSYREMPFRPAGAELTVLFHGGLHHDRGLEPLLRSVRLWRPGLRLVIRGKGDPAYEQKLRAVLDTPELRARVVFEPPVAPSEVVSAAHASADVGIHPMPALTRQTRFALPNKLFEYTMAGLAVCVVSGSEMARLVTERGNGVLLPECSPTAIAGTLNALDTDQVNRLKQASLSAATKLCWESEQTSLAALYERV